MSSGRVRRVVIAVVFLAALPFLAAAGGGNGGQSDEARAEHQRIIDFWTAERVAQAVPRDFYLNPSTGRFAPARKPAPPGPGTGVVSGSSWNGGGAIDGASGKVLFEMGGSYWICSATVITDSASDRSLILTAAHCVYDETESGMPEGFATNWMFIPDYDAAPAPLTTSGSFCSSTLYGCWTAEAMVVGEGYAYAGGFNDTAVVHDFAVVAVGEGGKNETLLEDVLGIDEQPLLFNSVAANRLVYAFGYPAEKKWLGSDLIYCRGPVGFDPLTDGATYRLSSCALNGGSSGGPWLVGFNEGSGSGTVMSVNSYSYRGITAMHGPILNADTGSVYDTALGASGGTIAPDVP